MVDSVQDARSRAHMKQMSYTGMSTVLLRIPFNNVFVQCTGIESF